MKLLFTSFIITFLSLTIFSQTKISGKITDEKNQPLPGANIYLKDTYDGVSTEADGTFSFTSEEEGEFVLIVSFVGYLPFTQKINLDGKNKQIDIVLKEDAAELGTVVISAGSFEASDENKAVILRPLDILTTGADADIYSTLETLPGTQQIGETEGLFVRGGSASETKTLIDEMAVQNPFYSSIPDIPSRGRFSPMLFKGIVFSTGGYSAQYGQALSSVLVLKTQDLPEKTQSAISIMPLGLGGSHTQRWENSSFSFEGGYYNLGPYFQVQKQRTDWDKAPESFAGSFNFRYKTSKTGMLKAFTSYSTGSLSLYSPNLDSLPVKDFFRQKSNNLFVNTNFREILWDDWTIFAGYSLGIDKENDKINLDQADKDDIFHTGKFTITKNILSNTILTFGGEAQTLDHKSSFNQLSGSFNETYLAGYLETEIFFTNDFAGRIGARAENSKLLNKTNIAPRLSFAYRLGAYDQLNFAYGKFYQTPDPDFLLYSKNFEFENADHFIFNYQYIGTDRTFRIEVYYKNYNNLAKGTVFSYPYFNLPTVPFGSNGKGYAKGVDVFWRDQATFENTDYWISYSYLDTKRDFKNYPTLASPPFSAPHTFSIVAKRWIQPITTLVGLTYTFATGRPYFNPNNPEFLSDHAKDYQNLSLNASHLTSIFGNFTVIFFSIDNVLGYENLYGYNYSSDGKIKAPVLPPALRTFFIGVFISLGETNPY
ncbi:MAG: TonB-dependent receptor [Ignavibacteriota bacterium]